MSNFSHLYQYLRLYGAEGLQEEVGRAFKPYPLMGGEVADIDYCKNYRAWSKYHLPVALEDGGELLDVLAGCRGSLLPGSCSQVFGHIDEVGVERFLTEKLGGEHQVCLRASWVEISSSSVGLGVVCLGRDSFLGSRFFVDRSCFYIKSRVARRFVYEGYVNKLKYLGGGICFGVYWQVDLDGSDLGRCALGMSSIGGCVV